MTLIATVRAALRGVRFHASGEASLQAAIADVFARHDIPFEREVALAAADRVDFLVGGDLAVEVKVDGALSAVTRQLHRYAQHGGVRELVLVTTLLRHRGVPASLAGKPLSVIHIGSPF